MPIRRFVKGATLFHSINANTLFLAEAPVAFKNLNRPNFIFVNLFPAWFFDLPQFYPAVQHQPRIVRFKQLEQKFTVFGAEFSAEKPAVHTIFYESEPPLKADALSE